MTREFRDLDPERAAAALNVSLAELEAYESGLRRFTAHDLQRFARLLDVTPSFFLRGRKGRIAGTDRRAGDSPNVVSFFDYLDVKAVGRTPSHSSSRLAV